MPSPILSILAIVAVTGAAVGFMAWQAPEPEPIEANVSESSCALAQVETALAAACEAAGFPVQQRQRTSP